MIHLKTGNDNLNDILGSITFEPGAVGLAPVVLILGAAGTGKTLLALQVASTLARSCESLRVCFYSLEQSASSLQSTSMHFGLAGPAEFVDLAETDALWAQGKIHLCYFSPVPVRAEGRECTVFEQRFSELCHMLDNTPHETQACVFFIDSLNAIGTAELGRHEIYRFFNVFRAKGVPVVVTTERPAHGVSMTTSVPGGSIAEYSSFLADVVIELNKEESLGYQLHYLEVSKSRLSRQVTGRHLYKIRASVPEPGGGFVVYRSLPCVMSALRYSTRQEGNPKYQLCFETDRKNPQNALYRLMLAETINAGACFSLVGPFGTHKLALGMNLATGNIVRPRCGKLLLLTFGSFIPSDLSGVAYFDFRQHWAAWKKPATLRQSKKWLRVEFEYDQPQATEWGLSLLDESEYPAVSQLIFPISYLTPEECLDYLWQVTEPKNGAQKYSAMLLTDTASICTGFPLLRKDPLFLPAVIDLFRRRGIVSVCIGVQGGEVLNRDMDFALQSSADYRIRLTHYPDFAELAKIRVEKEEERRAEARLAEERRVVPGDRTSARKDSDLHSEQLVNVVVDNVTGKHYGRKPRWLWVSTPEGKPKQLHCGYLESYKPEP